MLRRSATRSFRRSKPWQAQRLGFFKRATHWIPHPSKAATGGEDAFLSTDYVLGVCDGVSWWNEKLGVSAGLYSETLTRKAYEVIQEDWLGEPPASDPIPSLSLLVTAYERTQKLAHESEHYFEKMQHEKKRTSAAGMTTLEAGKCFGGAEDEATSDRAKHSLDQRHHHDDVTPTHLVIGTSTALFASIADSGLLQVANVGDCSCIVVRNGKIIMESETQHHSVATPFQLGTGSRDSPLNAGCCEVEVRDGDIVVIGSDGVFDNIYSHDIASLVSQRIREVAEQRSLDVSESSLTSPHKSMKTAASMQIIKSIIRLKEDPESFRTMNRDDMDQLALNVASLQILRQASLNAFDPKCDTPYAAACIEAGAYFEGGKVDDMTLIVAMVSGNPSDRGERVLTSTFVNADPYKNWP